MNAAHLRNASDLLLCGGSGTVRNRRTAGHLLNKYYITGSGAVQNPQKGKRPCEAASLRQFSWTLFRGRSRATAGVFLTFFTALVAFFPRLGFCCCAGCRRLLSRRLRLWVRCALVTPGLRHDQAGAQEQCDHPCRNLFHSIL